MNTPRHAYVYRRNRPDLSDPVQPHPPADQDRALNIDQVRQRLNCSRSHVYNMIQAGKIDAFRLGSRNGLRVKESEVSRFVADQESRESDSVAAE
jgi:excisionase family DNA binding protein